MRKLTPGPQRLLGFGMRLDWRLFKRWHALGTAIVLLICGGLSAEAAGHTVATDVRLECGPEAVALIGLPLDTVGQLVIDDVLYRIDPAVPEGVAMACAALGTGSVDAPLVAFVLPVPRPGDGELNGPAVRLELGLTQQQQPQTHASAEEDESAADASDSPGPTPDDEHWIHVDDPGPITGEAFAPKAVPSAGGCAQGAGHRGSAWGLGVVLLLAGLRRSRP